MQVYLTNLGAYNRGELRGNWVDPTTCDWQEELEKIGIGEVYDEYGCVDEEWFITDYDEAPDIGLGEYENLDHLTEVANYCEEYGMELVEAIYGECSDWEETTERLDSGDYMLIYLGDWCGDDDEKLGYAYVEEGLFGIEIPEALENYIDYAAIGRSIETGSCGTYVDIGDKRAYLELY